MKSKSTLLLALILITSTAVFAQKTDPVKPDPIRAAGKMPTVQEVLAKYVKAIGGREANEKIKSRMVTGMVELAPMGIKGTFESYAAGDAKLLTKLNLAGIGEILEGSDGKTAWTINPIQGSRDKAGQELAQTILSNSFYREINLDKLYSKMEMKGVEKVGEKDTYVIIATPEGLPATTWYFDTVGGLMLRSDSVTISPEGNQSSKAFFDEWRTVDGITIPVKVRAQIASAEIIMIASEIKHGVAIEESKFAKPKQ